MRTRTILLPLLLSLAFVAGAGGALFWRARAVAPHGPEAPRAERAERPRDAYYCPMHPSYRSDQPGVCPVCSMQLIPLAGEARGAPQAQVEGRGVVVLHAGQRQLIGVRTEPVTRRRVEKRVRAAGRVEADERRLSAVNLKVGGWVEELHVESLGETVARGAPLLALWSPELFEAQQSYALLHASGIARASAGEPTLHGESLRAARERLLLMDLTEEQVDRLETVPPERRTTIHSRVAGVVLRRSVVEGTYVEAGRDLFELAELSTVWVLADVYEHELAGLRVGLAAEVEVFSLPGARFAGDVAFVYPTLDERTRTQRVRLEVPNEDGRLKPGMFGAVTITLELGEPLSIADSAVLDTGTRALAFVEAEPGRFEPREVELGERGEGWVVVRRGLEPGERVVTRGTFLIDSESRLRAALPGGGEQKPAEGGRSEHRH
jgi:Cu(I)/Ag(I) efflux system membrane fusion protein